MKEQKVKKHLICLNRKHMKGHCPLPTPFIDTPENNLITDCANEFTVTGGFEGGSSGATETLNLV